VQRTRRETGGVEEKDTGMLRGDAYEKAMKGSVCDGKNDKDEEKCGVNVDESEEGRYSYDGEDSSGDGESDSAGYSDAKEAKTKGRGKEKSEGLRRGSDLKPKNGNW
jgi:hypothetical protein